MLLALNASLVDIVVSIKPHLGIEKLDRITRIISSIAIGFPFTIIIAAIFFPKRFVGSKYYWIFCAIVFFGTASFFSTAQRQVAEYFVDQTTPEQRQIAAAAVVGTYAISTGTATMPSIGFDKMDRSDPVSKVTAGVLMPYLILTGDLEKIKNHARGLVERTVLKNNELSKVDINRRLSDICTEAKQTHTQYYKDSKPGVEFGGERYFYHEKWKIYNKTRNQKIGYQGALPPHLPYEHFIKHQDTQYLIRRRMAEELDKSRILGQLEFLYSQAEQKTMLITLFDRKVIDPCMEWDAYLFEYGAPIGTHFGDLLENIVKADDIENSEYKKEYEAFGKQAVYALITPPLGIVWTLLAAALTLAAVLYRVLKVVPFGSVFFPLILAMAFLMFLFYQPYTVKNRFADSERVKQGFSSVEQYTGAPVVFMVEWGIRAAPIIYPIGYDLRQSIIGEIFDIKSI